MIMTVQGLEKYYGSKIAVNNISISIAEGETFGLLGHNGAGKTTFIECVLGVKPYTSGSVEVLGISPRKDRKSLFEQVGVQFQQTSYQDRIKVKEICEVTYSLYKEPADWRTLLKAFGLAEMEKRTVSELSGGERQKLSVLLALIPNPKLIFLDELTTGLDTKARRDVWKYLVEMKKKGLTIFLTSHYMDEVATLCDRICILKSGEIVIMDTVKNVIDSSPYDNLDDAYLWYSGEEV